MKALKEYIVEAKKVDFSKIDFYDFCDLFEDKAYDDYDRYGGVSYPVIYMKNIFGKDTIPCKVAGLSGSNEILKRRYPHTACDARFIYVDRTGPRSIGVYGVGNFQGTKFIFMYMKSMSELLECFGEENLTKIYNFINK
jgi:hypothetical protein